MARHRYRTDVGRVTLEALTEAVSGPDLAKLEGMKDVGVSK